MTRLLVYQNPNGVSVRKLSKQDNPILEYIKLGMTHGDDPGETTCILVHYVPNKGWFGELIWNPDWDELG